MCGLINEYVFRFPFFDDDEDDDDDDDEDDEQKEASVCVKYNLLRKKECPG